LSACSLYPEQTEDNAEEVYAARIAQHFAIAAQLPAAGNATFQCLNQAENFPRRAFRLLQTSTQYENSGDKKGRTMNPLLKKRFSPFGFLTPRALVALLFCGAACLTLTGTLPAFFNSEAPTNVSQRTLTFAERVAYQRAIEDVYWSHRIWPKENLDPKPSLDAVMSQVQLEKKVEEYLRNSQTLEDYWKQPITADQLQAEMDRMAQHTRQPEVLRELFAALGNDPFVIAECLARPLLAERLLTQSASEQVEQTSRTYEQVVAATGDYSLPSVSDEGGCTDNTWTATSTTNAPSDRIQHTAVWTGSEMIIWGGNYVPPPIDFNTGGRYSPSTDSWTATTTVNAPSGRSQHTAVWTGIEMIVWGGLDVFGQHFNTGGRYNPGTDSWTATSTTGAPAGGTAVWTGTELIVWGENAAGYNPRTDSWRSISTTGAPPSGGTAVWAGTEMIVWNGNTGGRYNPVMDSWTAISTTNAPGTRYGSTAVSTGSEMIIWGGGSRFARFLNTGRRYNPTTDSWTATSRTNAPIARAGHTAVWANSEMIIWGGDGAEPGFLNTGGRYNPTTDSWTATSTTNAPSGRDWHTAVWTGSEMIVWGGNNPYPPGARYCAATPPSPSIANPATYIASNSFTANWSSVSGATGYRLDVSPNSSFSTYVAGYHNLNVGNVTSRSVSGLNASTTYYYRVRAYNWAGTSGNSNVMSVTTLSPTGPPVAITNRATLIGSFSATLNGTVDPHRLTTTVYFQYGTTTGYGLTTAIQSKTGHTYQDVAANVTGLTANTTYHFRIVATNSAGTRYGSDRIFTTLSATGPPVVITNPATLIASFAARLNGTVDPHGLTTTVYFQYGTTTGYGLTTAIQSKTGNTYQNVAAHISGLTANTTYHFRIVATNSAGTRYGSDRTFTTLSATGPPVVITNPATLVASFSARLNGSVDPHGLATTAYFQYGTTTGYGLTTAIQSKTGNAYQNVAANIGGLSANTTYHFRMVGTNNRGTTYGSDRTFTTTP
jgi:N-acetylneuraminic acid mutarotase